MLISRKTYNVSVAHLHVLCDFEKRVIAYMDPYIFLVEAIVDGPVLDPVVQLSYFDTQNEYRVARYVRNSGREWERTQ